MAQVPVDSSVESARERLQNLVEQEPTQPRLPTSRELVAALYDDISAARGKGHSFDAIAGRLSGSGKPMTGETLATYFREETRKRRADKGGEE